MNKSFNYFYFFSRPMVCQRTAIQKSIQTARQFTQRVSNTVQQQRNVINNQSVLREVIVILYIILHT